MNALENHLSNFPYQLILCSASPRRQELLKGLGFAFEVKPTHADESFSAELKAEQIPLYLAKKKADAYTDTIQENEIIITSDTVVWCEGNFYNKPADFEEGKKMLSELAGKMHEVFTAVCLKGSNKQITFYDCSKVYFKKFSNTEIEYYLHHFKPYDKAGAYGVQDWLGYTGIEKIEGSFYTVMGFPVKMVYEELMKF